MSVSTLPNHLPTLMEVLCELDPDQIGHLGTTAMPFPMECHKELDPSASRPCHLHFEVHLPNNRLGEFSLPFSFQTTGDWILPLLIKWAPATGDPIVQTPLDRLTAEFQTSFQNISTWLTSYYLSIRPLEEVLQRFSDNLHNNIYRFLKQETLEASFPAATSLVRIDPYPEHLVPRSGSTAEHEFKRSVAATAKAKLLWPEQLDVAASSQSCPLSTASLATDGTSNIIASVPFNTNYLPTRRENIVRSIKGRTPTQPDSWRVHVKASHSPFEPLSVRLLTCFATTPFNSLDAQIFSQQAVKKLASIRTEHIRILNPVFCSLTQEDIGRVFHGNDIVAYSSVGNPVQLKVPENAYPQDHPENVGCATISAVEWYTLTHTGITVEAVRIEYTYIQPVISCDKVITPGSLKGVVCEVDFEAQAQIDGQWVDIEVISDGGQNDLSNPNRKPVGLEKRGTASALHGRLELLLETTNETMEVPRNVVWEDIPKLLPKKAAFRARMFDPILSGQVPVRVRHPETGEWEHHVCEVGLIPYIRTFNSIDVTSKVSDHAVPIHSITYASCLRRYKWASTDKTLLDWFLDNDTGAAQNVLELLSQPVSTEDPTSDIYWDGEILHYHGVKHKPVKLLPLQLVGNMSMEVLHPYEHTTPKSSYAQTTLDPQTFKDGGLIELPFAFRLPTGKRTRHLYFSPAFCQHYFKPMIYQPVSGRPIITPIAHWTNAWLEVIHDETFVGSIETRRRTQISKKFFELLLEEMTDRKGLLTKQLQARKPGWQYPNLALHACPPGVMWMSKEMLSKLEAVLGKPIPYGTAAVDVRFPVEPGSGLQGYVIEPMPSYFRNAHIIVNATSSAEGQDGDNDGDGKMGTIPPEEYRQEVLQMRWPKADQVEVPYFTPSTFAIRRFESTPEEQISEAVANGSIKAQIGTASTLQYTYLLGHDWSKLGEDQIEEITLFWSAILHAAVKKDLDIPLTWDLQSLLNGTSPELEKTIERNLLDLYRHKPKDYLRKVLLGYGHVVEFYKQYPLKEQKPEMLSAATINAGFNAPALLIKHLKKLTPKQLISGVCRELVFGRF